MASRTSKNLIIAALMFQALIFSARTVLTEEITGSPASGSLSGDDMMELGDYAGAISLYGKDFLRHPDSAGTANKLGFAHIKMKDWAKAQVCFETAVKLDPTMAVAYNNLGSSLYQQKKWKEAGKMFRKAIKLDSTYAKAWVNLGSSYYRRRRYFKAMRCLVKAKSIDSAYFETRALSGNAGRELGTAKSRGNPFLVYAAEVVKKKKEEVSSMKAGDVIEKVNLTYARFEKASGRIQRTTSQSTHPSLTTGGEATGEGGGKIQISKGSFFVNWPERLLRIEYFEPIERVLLINSSGTWMLNPAEKTAQVIESPASGASMDILLSLNPFSSLKDGFDMKRIEDHDDSIIIEAKPQKPLKLSRILVKVDPKTWTAQALELFNLNGELLSQTKYENFKSFKTLFFPTEFVTRLKTEETLIIERSKLSRIKLNKKQKVSFSTPEGYIKSKI